MIKIIIYLMLVYVYAHVRAYHHNRALSEIGDGGKPAVHCNIPSTTTIRDGFDGWCLKKNGHEDCSRCA